jgi:branched-chain amino acid transport system substrate-binding protein
MTRKSTRILLAGLLGLLLAVGGLAPAAAQAEDTYKIGGVFSVTGPTSFLGDPEKKSLEMAVDLINKKGGIDGRKVEAIVYDTEMDPTKAVNAVNKLIYKDKVHAVVGPSLTPTSLAVVPIAQRAQVPLISCAAGVKITTPVKPWVFKTAQTDVMAVATIYRHMQDHGIDTVGTLNVSNAFGESGREQLLKQAPDYGIEVVRAESFGAKDTDMTAQLTKIRKDNPDAIIVWGTNPGPAVIAKNVEQLGIDIPIYQSHGVASPKYIELAGEAAEGNKLPTGKILVADLLPEDDPAKEVLENYINKYETRYGIKVSGFGGYAWDAMGLLEIALKGTDGDRVKIRDNLEAIDNYLGVTGTFDMSAKDHNGLGQDAFVMVEIRNGTWKLLE